MPYVPGDTTIESAFDSFWSAERTRATAELCEAEGLRPEAFATLVEEYHFSGKVPLQRNVVEALESKPKILERKTVVARVVEKLLKLVSTFDEGLG